MEPQKYSIWCEGQDPGEAMIEAVRMRFSPARCFPLDGSEDETRCLQIIADHLMRLYGRPLGNSAADRPNLALFGGMEFCLRLLEAAPQLGEQIACILTEEFGQAGGQVGPVPVVALKAKPPGVCTIFVCESSTSGIRRAQRILPQDATVLTPEILAEIDWTAVPNHSWLPFYDCIYPLDIPDINFLPGQDIILLDCPSRNLGLMPNGVAYVHNALRREGFALQTVDLDMIIYHRYHQRRLMDEIGCGHTPGGKELPEDPWHNDHMHIWRDPDFIETFRPEITEIVAKLGQARPKVLGLSISQTSEFFSREVVRGVRNCSPDTVILVGGFSCLHPWKGLRVFPECDYMVIGEADLSVGSLVRQLVEGQRPRDLPGLFSQYDSPMHSFNPGPMLRELDTVDFPRYEWTDIKTYYRNFNHYLLAPVVSNRGCHWSRCRFCGERFKWRPRDPVGFVNELEWLYEEGCYLFVINDSDLNGSPELVMEICDEILRRDLKVRIAGQLRVDRRNTVQFFQKMRRAGFHMLRFGVDAWAKNTLRIQNKGYTVDTIRQNLRNCSKAGIAIEVNAVIGVPGETEEDIDQTIELLLENKDYINIFANLNPLALITESEFWKNPEKYGIQFREDREILYRTNPDGIPPSAWYSTDPYIDDEVRLGRCKRMVETLAEAGFNFGIGATPIINRFKAQEKAAELEVSKACGEKTPETEAENTIVVEAGASIAETSGQPNASDQSRQAGSAPQSPMSPREQVVVRHAGLFLRLSDQPCPASAITGIHRINPTFGIDMVKGNISGYNIIKVLSDYYAVQHGYLFEIDDVDNGKYPPGTILKGKTVPEVVRQIDAQGARFRRVAKSFILRAANRLKA